MLKIAGFLGGSYPKIGFLTGLEAKSELLFYLEREFGYLFKPGF